MKTSLLFVALFVGTAINGAIAGSCTGSTYPAVDTKAALPIQDSSPSAGITWSHFANAVTFNGYPKPCLAQYNAFIKGLPAGGIKTAGEAAMFLANVIHESGGLQLIEETACSGAGGCPWAYQYTWGNQACLVPGVQYYGRGYIQLTWCYNYGWFSKAHFGNTRTLLKNPEKVSQNETLAWASSVWYWNTRVHDDPAVAKMNFGATINDINGGIECSAPGNDHAQQRIAKYLQVRKAFGLTNAPNLNGCPPIGPAYVSKYGTIPCLPLD